MNVTLTPDAEKYVRTKLASGEFQSTDGIVNEALRLLEQRENWKREVNAKIKAGLSEIEGGLALSSEESAKERARRKDEILSARSK